MQNQIVVCWKPRPLPYWILLSKQLLADWFSLVPFVFSANQKPSVICTRVTGELHSFFSQYELNIFSCTLLNIVYVRIELLYESCFKSFQLQKSRDGRGLISQKRRFLYLFISSAVTKLGLYLPELAPRRFFENAAYQIIFVKGATIIWERRLFDTGA